MNIRDVKWPIYALGPDVTTFEDMNVLYVEHSGITSILDNKNLAGSTLGKRRLQIRDEKIYHFKRTLFMLAELIDYTRPKKISDRKFIDTNGKLFTYNKTVTHSLIWRKVTFVENLSSTTVLNVDRLSESFEIPNNYYKKFIKEPEVWLGLLRFDKYHILYDIDTEVHKDTWRKV